MRQDRTIQLRMDAGTYYIWVGGSTDYAHKERHKSVVVKLVPYHKFHQLPQTHEMAHQAMLALRREQ